MKKLLIVSTLALTLLSATSANATGGKKTPPESSMDSIIELLTGGKKTPPSITLTMATSNKRHQSHN